MEAGWLRHCCLLLALSWATPLPAAEFSFQEVRIEQPGDQFTVDLQVRYQFSEVALKALENGVPLTLDIHFQVRREGAWVWESDVVDTHLRRELRYLPLSSTYEVRYLADQERSRFVSRSAAIQALGQVDDFPLLNAGRLKPEEDYFLEVRSELDIEALPVPLRPTAYMSSAWDLSSDWSHWRIEQ
ncbi:MAG: DUF4390 domain-containing protein [Chromatiales bacterium]|jgi:hypothetical protein